ncbi:MAG: 4Fe-4S dicluster domain-containing protein [Candidatus Eiseniibacteriota bacterium]|jgi:NADH-quinone oxidoreductase subunit I
MNAIAQYLHNIVDGIGTTLAGMRVTMKYLRSPETTIQYPDQRMQMFDRFRGLLHNRIEDCIGCAACARACPVDCIVVITQKASKDVDLGQTRDGTAKKLHVYQFDIDTLKCIWCNLCTEVCPTESLTMSSEYEVASYDRDEWLLRFATEEPPADFDLEAARLKQKVTNPVEYAGEADPRNLEVPAGSWRPTSGAALYDYLNHRRAAIAEQEAARKAAAKAAAPKPAAPKPAAAKPEAAKPAAAKPEAATPDAAKPETAKPGTAKPATPKPATPKPEAGTPGPQGDAGGAPAPDSKPEE